MTRNFTDKEKEYLRIASRFLKEVGLYDLWIRYLYDSDSHPTWREKECEEPHQILSWTLFTDFVETHRGDLDLKGYCIYEIFIEYLKKMNTGYPNDDYGILDVDKEKKKVKFRDYLHRWK